MPSSRQRGREGRHPAVRGVCRSLAASRRRALVALPHGRRAAGACVLLSEVRRARVRRRLNRGRALAFGNHIRAGWITHATRHPCAALWRQLSAAPEQRPQLV